MQQSKSHPSFRPIVDLLAFFSPCKEQGMYLSIFRGDSVVCWTEAIRVFYLQICVILQQQFAHFLIRKCLPSLAFIIAKCNAVFLN